MYLLQPSFDQDLDVQNVEMIFLISNRPNDKMNRKHKKRPEIDIKVIFIQKI